MSGSISFADPDFGQIWIQGTVPPTKIFEILLSEFLGNLESLLFCFHAFGVGRPQAQEPWMRSRIR